MTDDTLPPTLSEAEHRLRDCLLHAHQGVDPWLAFEAYRNAVRSALATAEKRRGEAAGRVVYAYNEYCNGAPRDGRIPRALEHALRLLGFDDLAPGLGLQLTKSGWLDDWYVLEGGGNWACIEGTSEEWRGIAAALRTGKAYSDARRCYASAPTNGHVEFWSPRNGYRDCDTVRLPAERAGALADHIDRVLAAYASEEEDSSDGE